MVLAPKGLVQAGLPKASASLGGGKLVDTKGRNHPGSEGVSAQLYLTIYDPMDGSLPGSSVHGILQARILEWVAIPFSIFTI